jgi:hypothetical protein
MPPTPAANTSGSSHGGSWVRRHGLAVAMALAFLAPAAVLWTIGWMRGRAACDQFDYHLKVIEKFAAELPRPDLHDYASATTPGYHLLIGMVERVLGLGPTGLQVAASVFTILLLWVVTTAVLQAGSRRGRASWELAALVLPVVASPYVFTSGVWLLPDNAGWLLVMLVLLISLSGWMGSARHGARALVLGAFLLVLTVLVRQNHLWVAAPFVIAAWLSRTGEEEGCLASAVREPGSRLGPTVAALLACLPAIGVLAWFVHLWHGLTPPSFQAQHQVKNESHINWATPPFILALVGVFSPFFVGWWWAGMVRLWRGARWALIGAAGAGFALAAVPVTTYLYEPRATGLWQVVLAMEHCKIAYIGGRTSVLILALATIGGPMLAAWLTIVDGKRRWIIATALGAFVAAQSANANCWQRYHEPFLLMLFALIAAGSARQENEGKLLRLVRIAGPIILGVLLAGLVVYGLGGRDPRVANP